MWWWRKVIRAQISSEVRQTLELFGETVIAFGLSDADIQAKGGPLAALLRGNWAAARDWLRERREIHERREDRLETVEWAIFIFVVVGVIVESGLGSAVWHYFVR